MEVQGSLYLWKSSVTPVWLTKLAMMFVCPSNSPVNRTPARLEAIRALAALT